MECRAGWQRALIFRVAQIVCLMTIRSKGHLRLEAILLPMYKDAFFWGYVSPQGGRHTVCDGMEEGYSRNGRLLQGLIHLNFWGRVLWYRALYHKIVTREYPSWLHTGVTGHTGTQLLRSVVHPSRNVCGSSPGEASSWEQPDAAEDTVPTGAANHGMRVLTVFQFQAHVAHMSLNLWKANTWTNGSNTYACSQRCSPSVLMKDICLRTADNCFFPNNFGAQFDNLPFFQLWPHPRQSLPAQLLSLGWSSSPWVPCPVSRCQQQLPPGPCMEISPRQPLCNSLYLGTRNKWCWRREVVARVRA